MAGKLTFAWSLSRLKDFERCPKLYWYRMRRSEYPEPPSKALERGNRIHALFEAAMAGEKLEGAMARYQDYVDEHRAKKGVEVERMWAFDRNFAPVESDKYGRGDGVWCRAKLDVYCQMTPKRGKVIDWKTGQIYGDHAEGGRLYAVGAFMRYPKITLCDVEFVYVDQRRAIEETIKRAEVPAIINDFTRRAEKVEAETKFAPNPGRHCGWCPYNAEKGGPCTAGKDG